MIDVYIAELPSVELNEPLSCEERQKGIDKIKNERARREKYYVWRLLEYAIKNSLGADASRLYFTRGENGRWICKDVEFSLSHSGNALAVALLNNKIKSNTVGVDVESVNGRSVERLADYMLTPSEREELCSVEDSMRQEWLIGKWCQKEAIFKSQNKESFVPRKIEVAEFFSDVRKIELNGEAYMLAVASVCSESVNVIDGLRFDKNQILC